MKRTAALALVLACASVLPAQTGDFRVVTTTFPGGMLLDTQVAGPALTPYTTYLYLGNPFVDPLDLGLLVVFFSGTTDAMGEAHLALPLQIPGFTLPEINGGAIFTPPSDPPIVTEIVALTLTTAGPVVPPCAPSVGAMTYDPELCVLDLSAHVCPGAVVTLKKNGVVISTVTAGPSGSVGIVKTECLGPGDVATAEVNGAPFLGPIRR